MLHTRRRWMTVWLQTVWACAWCIVLNCKVKHLPGLRIQRRKMCILNGCQCPSHSLPTLPFLTHRIATAPPHKSLHPNPIVSMLNLRKIIMYDVAMYLKIDNVGGGVGWWRYGRAGAMLTFFIQPCREIRLSSGIHGWGEGLYPWTYTLYPHRSKILLNYVTVKCILTMFPCDHLLLFI